MEELDGFDFHDYGLEENFYDPSPPTKPKRKVTFGKRIIIKLWYLHLQCTSLRVFPRNLPQAPESNDNKILQSIHNVLTMTRQRSDKSAHVHPLIVDANHNEPLVEGPPTPTETPDCTKVPVPVGNSTASDSLLSLQRVLSSLQALRLQGPSITPSLVNHYRDNLVNHIRGWPTDILEKQSEQLAQEAHIMGSIQCTKVSIELKSTRLSRSKIILAPTPASPFIDRKKRREELTKSQEKNSAGEEIANDNENCWMNMMSADNNDPEYQIFNEQEIAYTQKLSSQLRKLKMSHSDAFMEAENLMLSFESTPIQLILLKRIKDSTEK
ncbi:hypothetical protein FQA39_LY07895 [Lamprigera yunnana]|nr:hypothetical protein FQA39_LY07895 [Lamprigera yunnana]